MPATDRPTPCVLIVDPSEETRLVLAELLTRTGVAADTTGSVAAACDDLTRTEYATLVIDVDALSPLETRLLIDRGARSGAAVVTVGTNRPAAADQATAFVRKPYHYRELIHKIWASLGVVGTQARAVA